MGDRANVCCKIAGDKSGVYLYTHLRGSELPVIVKNALIRGKNRWGDDSYLNRIIFSDMIKHDIDGETGFGISVDECDSKTILKWRTINFYPFTIREDINEFS